MREELATDPIHIHLTGAFDGLTARRLEAVLAQAGPGARLRVDLSKVREFHDFGLAVLAQAMTRCKARVTLLGLGQHQIRVLRYFGVDTAPLERAVSTDVDDAASEHHAQA
jgi:anti-anti-sigma regulatory factor